MLSDASKSGMARSRRADSSSSLVSDSGGSRYGNPVAMAPGARPAAARTAAAAAATDNGKSAAAGLFGGQRAAADARYGTNGSSNGGKNGKLGGVSEPLPEEAMEAGTGGGLEAGAE